MILANYHTHSTFCDGKNTPEEMVRAAIDRGFSALGFSAHGYTAFDLHYCVKDMAAYLREIRRLKEAYRSKIQIYVGLEEDAHAPTNDRAELDYVIGSSHYSMVDGKHYPIDSSYELFTNCIKAWNGNALAFAEEYYSFFCRYLVTRRPDIIGHFDVITKYDEQGSSLFLNDPEYRRIAEHYLRIALTCGAFFEVNTGAIFRRLRSMPYPAENLLHILQKEGGRLILSSDCHTAEALSFQFDEARRYLRELGFRESYVLLNGRFIAEPL